ncbi:MAG: DUF2442 domain-containing protein [Phycisphaerae bacterium]|nr:DUF2442 domain-containing protein [Planctomycetia bacterium]
MYKSVKSVKACERFQLEVEFMDGLRSRVDLSARLFGAVFEPLRDTKLFEQVYVDEFGAVCWPNGADLAPDALYETAVAGRRSPTDISGA